MRRRCTIYLSTLELVFQAVGVSLEANEMKGEKVNEKVGVRWTARYLVHMSI